MEKTCFNCRHEGVWIAEEPCAGCVNDHGCGRPGWQPRTPRPFDAVEVLEWLLAHKDTVWHGTAEISPQKLLDQDISEDLAMDYLLVARHRRVDLAPWRDHKWLECQVDVAACQRELARLKGEQETRVPHVVKVLCCNCNDVLRTIAPPLEGVSKGTNACRNCGEVMSWHVNSDGGWGTMRADHKPTSDLPTYKIETVEVEPAPAPMQDVMDVMDAVNYVMGAIVQCIDKRTNKADISGSNDGASDHTTEPTIASRWTTEWLDECEAVLFPDEIDRDQTSTLHEPIGGHPIAARKWRTTL